jgi:CheY-like chemotaxis protein
MMPDADGFMVVDELRLRHPDQQVPVALLAALGADGQPTRMPECSPIVRCIIRQGFDEDLAGQLLQSVHQILRDRSSE